MNLRTLVKVSNIVAGISILLLIYWVFVFIAVQVFGFRIFRENISQTFGMSILGILALMAGSLMINVMFNLTRIAQKHNQDQVTEFAESSKKWLWTFVLSFPLLFVVLYAGDYLTSVKKEKMLVGTARSILETNAQRGDRLANYQFSNPWLVETSDTLDLFQKSERNFPHASLIVRDEIDGSPVFLAFNDYTESKNDKGEIIEPEKRRFITATTQEERDYLNRVFDSETSETRFSASDGNYQLFYPYVKDGKRIILYFSDYQSYGKLGS